MSRNLTIVLCVFFVSCAGFCTFAEGATNSPERECRSACGFDGVKSVTEGKCECK